jgi:hypothetical protein
MWLQLLERWGGPCAILGGLLWTGCAIVIAQMPEGCMADECYRPGRSMRQSDAVAPGLTAAIALIAVGGAALVRRAAQVERLGRMGEFGLVIAGGGLGLLAAGTAIQALHFGGDFPVMPLFVLPGGLALILGALLLAVAVLRAGVVPRWAAALLILGALALIGYNDQNARVLLAVPFGLGWVAIGWSLLQPAALRAD